MKNSLRAVVFAVLLGQFGAGSAADLLAGRNVDELLFLAKESNPDYAMAQQEAAALAERSVPAGALPDPRFRVEWRDITKMGEQSPTLLPNRVGSTRYLLMQDVPWFGKRDLKREVAELEADAARARVRGTWAELSARIKTVFAQRYYVQRNALLTAEVLDLMVRLEKVAQARYANGLAAQQDVIRAQVEQTNLRHELQALQTEQRSLDSRMNTLLARPAATPLTAPEALRPLPAPAKLDPAAVEDRARERNPLLFAEESRIKAAERSRELTYKERYPDFSFGISPIQYENSVREWEVMIELNIPLQQSSRRAQERESEAMLAVARTRREGAANQIVAELSENLAAIEAARHSEELTTTSLLPQAELTFRAALAGYENGKVDFATLLDAQRQIRLARQNQLKAQTEAQTRLAEIERILGEDL